LPEEFKAPVREFVPRLSRLGEPAKPDRFIGTFYGEQATHEQLRLIISRLEMGVSEMMCHPGYADQALLGGSAYGKPRERELEILTAQSARRMLAELGIRLITYSDLIRRNP
jgi:predicted glycoside hydrolase/deacetylase ChbG (UPF0249 family)